MRRFRRLQMRVRMKIAETENLENNVQDDDRPVGRVLSRREVLALFGLGAASVLAACVPGLDETTAPPAAASPSVPAPAEPATIAVPSVTAGPLSGLPEGLPGGLPACIVVPEQTEGPFFLEERLNRSDIRTSTADGAAVPGIPLELTLRVARISEAGCAALAGAVVDIWQCDAAGVYSGVQGAGGQDFLRGCQVTDENGIARFTTIYPGWYPGRAVHIHFKIRTDPESAAGYDFTSQFYFDDALSDQVFTREPYNQRGARSTRNEQDAIFRQGGEQLILPLEEADQGCRAVFNIGLQIT
jgi:protocatechuate 3,4-dioxygenase beta subunit